MLKRLRCMLRGLMAEVPVTRPPVIRRSDEPDMLLATDLPLLTDEASLARLMERATQAGWRWDIRRGWLTLDHAPVTWPVESVPAGEAACVLRLLTLHPGGGTDEEAARELMKAADRGPTELERCCQRLHHRYAALLRQRQPLPEGLIPVLLCAAASHHKENEG